VRRGTSSGLLPPELLQEVRLINQAEWGMEGTAQQLMPRAKMQQLLCSAVQLIIGGASATGSLTNTLFESLQTGQLHNQPLLPCFSPHPSLTHSQALIDIKLGPGGQVSFTRPKSVTAALAGRPGSSTGTGSGTGTSAAATRQTTATPLTGGPTGLVRAMEAAAAAATETAGGLLSRSSSRTSSRAAGLDDFLRHQLSAASMRSVASVHSTGNGSGSGGVDRGSGSAGRAEGSGGSSGRRTAVAGSAANAAVVSTVTTLLKASEALLKELKVSRGPWCAWSWLRWRLLRATCTYTTQRCIMISSSNCLPT
jgi:hypothetical protein